MDWDLNGLRIFARIAHHQSFAKAAGAMGLTPVSYTHLRAHET